MISLKSIYKSILVITGCFFLSLCYAQNRDIDLLRKINPDEPSSGFWKGMSHSAYVVGIGAPAGLWISGVVSKNRQNKIRAYELAGSVVIASLVTQGLKAAVDRPRPYTTYDDIYPDQVDNSSSFPSGHTTLSFATATTISLEYKKWYIVVPAYAWAAGVGYSRMYLGQHYPTDVISGAVIGTGGALLSHWLTKKIFK